MSRAKKTPPPPDMDVGAILGTYRSWLARQSLAEHSRDAYAAQVGGFLAWLSSSEHGAAAFSQLSDPHVRDWAVRDYKRHVKTDARSVGEEDEPSQVVERFAEVELPADPAAERLVGEPPQRHDDQTTQAHCHSLVVNACVLSTTGYLEDAIDAQRADGHSVSDEAISHLSPGHYEPINPYGMLNIDVADVVERPRRPIRSA